MKEAIVSEAVDISSPQKKQELGERYADQLKLAQHKIDPGIFLSSQAEKFERYRTALLGERIEEGLSQMI